MRTVGETVDTPRSPLVERSPSWGNGWMPLEQGRTAYHFLAPAGWLSLSVVYLKETEEATLIIPTSSPI